MEGTGNSIDFFKDPRAVRKTRSLCVAVVIFIIFFCYYCYYCDADGCAGTRPGAAGWGGKGREKNAVAKKDDNKTTRTRSSIQTITPNTISNITQIT